VIAETCWDQKSADVVAHGVDAFVMGDDWQGRFDFLKPLCDVVYLPRTEGVSSSLLKQQVVGGSAA
jgi:glycerol-3-phosphate cytidylyltransferase